MPNVTITSLPQALPLTGTESVPIVQGGQTRQTTTGAIANAPILNQTFLTIVQEPTLPNSRYLSTSTGLGLTDGGAQSFYRLTLNGASGSLEVALTGIIAKDSASSVVARSITSGSDGISITNGNGVSGNPTVALSGPVLSLASLASTGMLSIGGGSVNARVLYGTTNEISVANGNGTADPVFRIADNAVFPGVGAVRVPNGTTAERPPGANGQIRYNTQTGNLEAYTDAVGWGTIITGAGVSSFSAGSTGFSPSVATTGAVILSGILNPASGGTGVNNGSYSITLGGNVSTAGAFTTSGAYPLTLTTSSATTLSLPTTGTLATLAGSEVFTNKTISGSNNTLSNIGNSSLTNSSITINGSSVSLGGSVTVTATASNALTIGTGLSGTSYNGSAPVTIAIDSSVVTLTGSQVLTNKSLSGSSNTFTDIPNAALTNSSITIGSTSVALGGTITTFSGTSISGSTNTLSNIGNSSLTNSSVTYNGVTVALGAAGTITAATPNALTVGTGLQLNSGTTFDGSAAKTISIDSTVATLTGSQTLTNKSISGSSNTLTNIPNSALTNSSVTIGTTAISLGSSSLTLGGLTSVAVTQNPTSNLQLATKQYVDNLVSTGLVYHQPVQAATTQSLENETGGTVTYDNGVDGVGATLTLSSPLTTLDGYSLSNTNRVLVKNQSNQAYNGIYTWATGGYVLTRATDADTYGTAPNQLSENDYFFVQNGTVNKGSSYVVTTSGTIVFGTTAITFAQFSTSQVYTGTSPVVVSGTVISLTTVPVTLGGTGITSGTSGGIPYFSTGTTIASSALLDANRLMIGGGAGAAPATILTGTGVITAIAGDIGTVGSLVVNGGALGTPSSGVVTNLTGTASININGTVGATSPNTGAFTTISALGVITSTVATGTAPFTVASTTQVANLNAATAGSATNATNATYTEISANTTNATHYLTFVSATTGNLSQLVNSSITCNPSTGQITGGISGGTF